MRTTRRLLSIFVAFCLIFSQTVQAYSFAWLPHQYRHSIPQGQRITSGKNNNVDSSNSMPWQSSSGHGQFVKTVKLANIKAGEIKGAVIELFCQTELLGQSLIR